MLGPRNAQLAFYAIGIAASLNCGDDSSNAEPAIHPIGQSAGETAERPRELPGTEPALGACPTAANPQGGCPIGAQCSNTDFGAETNYAVLGTQPSFIAAGLLNGDAYLDLVTANQLSDSVSVLLGRGDGTFAEATTFAATSPNDMELGDFDGQCQLICDESRFANQCGDSCCADGIACEGGQCACPSGYVPSCVPEELAVVDFCCLEGAPCADGVCGCPPGRAQCGQLCCSTGYVCNSGECVKAGSGGGCPSFDDLCSCSGCLAGTITATCSCPSGTTQFGDEIGCAPGESSGCIQCVCD